MRKHITTAIFGDLRLDDTLPWWYANVLITGNEVKTCICEDEEAEPSLETEDKAQRAAEQLAPLLQRLQQQESRLRSSAATQMSGAVESWHLPEEGPINATTLEAKMQLTHVFLGLGGNHSLTYLVTARPTPYELMVELDGDLAIVEMSAN